MLKSGTKDAEDTLNAREPPTLQQMNETVKHSEEYGYSNINLDVLSISKKYILWNCAIANYCLLNASTEKDVYLAITPRALAAAIAKYSSTRLSPEEAESNFVNTVSSAYRNWVLKYSAGLTVFQRSAEDRLPKCIAFLALSVLAAYRMQSDQETSANAYYQRLAELLGCEHAGTYPTGFNTGEFEKLWFFLQKWLAQNKSISLAMPEANSGPGRFLAFPLTHVPLRKVDTEKLPDFFAWADYTPGCQVPLHKLEADISRWAGTRYLTRAGVAALKDKRRRAVVAQIAHELELWDGSVTDTQGRRSATVEILFDTVRRQPQLSYLPKRPATFPGIFDDGVHSLESRVEGWYEPIPLSPEDGRELLEGFTWEVACDDIQLVLRRSGTAAIALVPSQDYTGFVSHNSLLLGIPCAVLVHESLVAQATGYLNSISARQYQPKNHPRLPEGWYLFRDVKAERHPETVPEGLEALNVESTADIVPSGGLRLGRKSAWLLGAPPRLLIAGLQEGQQPKIDGEPVAVTEDGILIDSGHLERPGIHTVEVGSLIRRFEIIEPAINLNPEAIHNQSAIAHTGTTIALPKGSWTIIGAIPGEVEKTVCNSQQGTIVQCSFRAVWAIDVGSRSGATVLCLAKILPIPQLAGGKTITQRLPNQENWISVIYNAAIRRPRLGTLHEDSDNRLVEVWKAYVQKARQLKRWSKRRRK
jgi:hypothetical protein